MKRSFSITIVLALLSALFLAPGAHAFAPKKGDKPCIDCHKLDKKDAEVIVKKIVPAATVTDVKMSPVKGVWLIEFDAGAGKHGGFGLDFSKKYLVQFATVEAVVKQQQPQPQRKVDFSRIPLGDALVLGSATAKKKVIVFSDPDCPFCRQLHPIMKQIIEKHGDVAFYIILNPLPMHKDSPRKVQAILCSKSITMLDDAFTGKSIPEPAANCTPEAMERSMALAKSLEFNGTPTLVREDGTVLSGWLPEEKLLEWIDKKQ
jgi:thiol:disulfide interchange protein DsbC